MSDHPDYMGVWCPTCQQDCIPMRSGRCGFCDTRVIGPETDAPTATVEPPTELEEPVPPTCKHPDCERPAADRRGMYAGLCTIHKAEKRLSRQTSRPAVPVVPPPGGTSRRERERSCQAHTDRARPGRRPSARRLRPGARAAAGSSSGRLT